MIIHLQKIHNHEFYRNFNSTAEDRVNSLVNSISIKIYVWVMNKQRSLEAQSSDLLHRTSLHI